MLVSRTLRRSWARSCPSSGSPNRIVWAGVGKIISATNPAQTIIPTRRVALCIVATVNVSARILLNYFFFSPARARKIEKKKTLSLFPDSNNWFFPPPHLCQYSIPSVEDVFPRRFRLDSVGDMVYFLRLFQIQTLSQYTLLHQIKWKYCDHDIVRLLFFNRKRSEIFFF